MFEFEDEPLENIQKENLAAVGVHRPTDVTRPLPSAAFIEQAKLINKCSFHLTGYGWFDVSTEEFAYILELASKRDGKAIKKLYDRLSSERCSY